MNIHQDQSKNSSLFQNGIIPAKELENQRTPPPISTSFLEIEVLLIIKRIIKL